MRLDFLATDVPLDDIVATMKAIKPTEHGFAMLLDKDGKVTREEMRNARAEHKGAHKGEHKGAHKGEQKGMHGGDKGAPPAVPSIHTRLPSGMLRGSTAMERCGVRGTPMAPRGPVSASAMTSSRKNTTRGLAHIAS